MANESNDLETWPDLAASLYDKLTGKGSTINYKFDEFSLKIPSKVGSGAQHASWVINGTLSISTENS